MWTRRSFFHLLTAGVVAPVAAAIPLQVEAPGRLSTRREEIAAFQAFAESTHPRGPVAAADTDWRRRWQALSIDSVQLSDGAYFHRLRRALGWFRDGHTTVLPFEFVGGVPPQLADGPFRLTLPMRLRVFDDGAWVVAAGGDASTLLGSRLSTIGRMSVPELMRALVVDWPGNDAWAHRWSAGALVSPAFLQALGAIDAPEEPISFGAASIDRRPLTNVLSPLEKEARQLQEIEPLPTPREGWAKTMGSGNYVRDIGDGVAYLSLDDMDDVDGKPFELLTREVFALLARAETRRLIIDLRRNGGGNNYFGEALRKGVGRSRCNQPGSLYVLVGPQTFSAAQNLANRLERETFAIFVGEPTGGAPNHYGDAQVQAGPATGITAMVSSLPWFDSYPQDPRPWILPDLPVPDTSDDWRSGRDRALETAIAHRNSAAPDDWSRDRVFYFQRATQQRDWSPFWRT
jgi:hypothetical protein